MADSVPAAVTRPGTPGAAPPSSDRVVGVAGIVLAAGAGTRLAPLTRLRPKVLCPVGNRPLVDLAIERVAAVGIDVAVNVHHGRDQLEPHLRARGDVHVEVEAPVALGTAGAVANLRGWLDGQAALIVNGDTWCEPDLSALVAGWDGERLRVMVAGEPRFGPRSAIVASVLPPAEVARLDPVPSGLWEACWRRLVDRGEVDVVAHDGAVLDCGTPARYLRANRWVAAGGADPDGPGPSLIDPSAELAPSADVTGSVVGADVTVAGTVRDSVLWPGTTVAEGEVLVGAIRADHHITVLVR